MATSLRICKHGNTVEGCGTQSIIATWQCTNHRIKRSRISQQRQEEQWKLQSMIINCFDAASFMKRLREMLTYARRANRIYKICNNLPNNSPSPRQHLRPFLNVVDVYASPPCFFHSPHHSPVPLLRFVVNSYFLAGLQDEIVISTLWFTRTS